MIIRFHAILVAAFVFTLVFACVAGAQETTLESDDGSTVRLQDGTDQQRGRGDFARGAADNQYRNERNVEDRVIRETIPNKGRLAGTGGVPLTGAALLALASVGLGVSILRFAIRRER
jgi:hypothetical protein